MVNILTNRVNLGRMADMYCGVEKKCEEAGRPSALFSMRVSRNTLFALLLCVLTATSLAGYDDGYITAGEYEYGIFWDNNDQSLVVDGGGASDIQMESHSNIKVLSTSTPPNGNWYKGGILDLVLFDYSHLNYYSGYTDIIHFSDNSTADIRGGNINHIRSLQYVNGSPHINIYCQDEWDWLWNDENGDGTLEIGGIAGLWEDGSDFSIDFIDKTHLGVAPVWENINVIEVPEPTSLLLITVGGMLLRKR